MNARTLRVLEYDKILARLAGYCDFTASAELASALQPTIDHAEARRWLTETAEARYLLSTRDLTIGGSHDIRPAADLAARSGVLDPQALLDIKSTLIACRDLKKSLENAADHAPHLARTAEGLPETHGLVDAISRVLSERGEVLDSASTRLADIRRGLKVTRDRLMSRLQRYLTESAAKLQEPIITQRDGRYVIPLRAEFKGQIKAIVHDQSSSGATLFVEPLPVVELNNEVRELELAERDEERRLLAELSTMVGQHASELKYGIENLAVLDFAFARAKYAEGLGASEPILHELRAPGRPHGSNDQAAPAARPAIRLAACPPSVTGSADGGTDRRRPAGRDARHRHHRAEHGREDGDAQDRGSAGVDGAERARTSRLRAVRSCPVSTRSMPISATSNRSNNP